MKSYVDRVMRASSQRNELLSAYVQFLVLGMLVITFVAIRSDMPWETPPIVLLSAYTLVAAINLTLARVGFYRFWLPWVYSTVDVAILLAMPIGLTRLYHVGLQDALEVPGMALIFVILAHAALRYQPYLLLYTAGLFSLGWAMLFFFDRTGADAGTLELPFRVEYARLSIVILVAGILAFSVLRTRRLLIRSAIEARGKSNLAKYLPEPLVQEMADNGIHLAEQTRTQTVVVMFIDIRGFTTLSEHTPPGELVAILREFRTRLSQVILAHGGTIDKFIGDSIMVEFGVPDPDPADAATALACGRDLLIALRDWADDRRDGGQEVIRAGIGLHFGEVIAGAIGDARRLEYTVIGDTVNAAERIEALSHELDVPMLASRALLDAADEIPEGLKFAEVAPLTLRGRETPIALSACSLS